MNPNIGLQGYASLMRTQKNPYERDIATTANVINSMPRDGGATGLEGIGKIPLMYAMGRDTANAQEFDQQQAAQEQGYLSQVMQAEKDKLVQDQKDKAMKNYIELAGKDPDAANQLASGDPLLKSILPPGMRLKEKMNKDGWLTAETLDEDGVSKTTYQFNIGGIAQAKAKLAEQGINGTPTAEQLAAAMPQGYAFKLTGAAKPAKDETDKPQSQVVRDKTSPTGWSYLTEQGNMMQGAPDPYKGKKREGGGGDPRKEIQDFEGWFGKLNSLKTKRSNIVQGYVIDEFGQKIDIPGENRDAALRDIDTQIEGVTNTMKAYFPKQFETAFPPQRKILDGATASFILRNAGGDKELARKMAREQGYEIPEMPHAIQAKQETKKPGPWYSDAELR